MADLHLIRDVLDKQLVDARRRPMGRVDGIVVQVRAGARPRVVALEVGPVILLRRVSGPLARTVERLLSRWGFAGWHRLSPRQVRDIGLDLELDEDAEKSPIEAVERWLRDRVLSRIPGSGA